MPEGQAHAYDTVTGRWIGKRPVSWFTTFPTLTHTAPDGKRPPVQKVPKGKPRNPRSRKPVIKPAAEHDGVATENEGDSNAEDAR